MLTTTGFFLLMLFDYSTSLSNTRCFPLNEGGSTCFTRPDPLLALSWSSALEWCKNFGGTLPIPDTYTRNVVYGNAVDNFGLQTGNLWLGANFTYDLDNWYWANGTRFTGTLENRNSSGKTHAYIVRNGTYVKLVAAAPADSSSHICQYPYSELWCTNNPNSYWTSEKCNVKYRYGYSWYDYRSYCGQTNLACIDNLDDFSRWLDDLQTFWIGLRCSWWTWYDVVTGNSYEVIETQFGYLINLPDGTAQCLASYKDYYGNIRWTNLDCNSNLPFICQHGVNVTTTTSTTVVTTPTFNTETTTSTSTTTDATPTFNTETTINTSSITITSSTFNTEITISTSDPTATSPSFNPETTIDISDPKDTSSTFDTETTISTSDPTATSPSFNPETTIYISNPKDTSPTFDTETTISTSDPTTTSPRFNPETTIDAYNPKDTSPNFDTKTTISASNAPASSPTFNTETTTSTSATSTTTHGTDWGLTSNPTNPRTTVPQGETWTSNRPTLTASITSSASINSESHSVDHDVSDTTTATTPSPATTSSTSRTMTNASTARTTSDWKWSTTPSDSLTTTTDGVTATLSIQTTNITSSPKVTRESNSGNYGLAVGLGVVGGFLLLSIASQALLTVYVYKTIRHTTKISPT